MEDRDRIRYEMEGRMHLLGSETAVRRDPEGQERLTDVAETLQKVRVLNIYKGIRQSVKAGV